MTHASDPIQNLFGLKAEALEPLRAMNGVAADAFERVARENYAVLGACVEFAIGQMRLPATVTDAGEYLARQAETSRSFGEQLLRHTQAYLDIANTVRDQAQAATAPTTKPAAKPASKAA